MKKALQSKNATKESTSKQKGKENKSLERDWHMKDWHFIKVFYNPFMISEICWLCWVFILYYLFTFNPLFQTWMCACQREFLRRWVRQVFKCFKVTQKNNFSEGVLILQKCKRYVLLLLMAYSLREQKKLLLLLFITQGSRAHPPSLWHLLPI